MKHKKVGILGGTFDPIHLGHLSLAEAALTEMELDEVIFIPAAIPPHKERKISAFNHRVEMLKSVCRVNPKFVVSTIEGDLPKPSFTLDTMKALSQHFGIHHSIFFIIGSDAFLEITTWKGYEKILAMVHFVIGSRGTSDMEQLPHFLQSLGYYIQEDRWLGYGKQSVNILDTVPPRVSSTDIRSFFADGKKSHLFGQLLDSRVEEYILSNGLYRNG